MWHRMIDMTLDYENGSVDLESLCAGLRGLFVEADPHDPTIRSDFETYWSPIEMEHETRTAPWAPAGSADDTSLARSLARFREWIVLVLADTNAEHG